MNYEAYTYDELKSEEDNAKKAFYTSATLLTEKKVILSEHIGILAIDKKLTAFNDYVCGLVQHKHLASFSETLRKFLSKREDLDKAILDSYISELQNHFALHTHYINIKILLKHRTVFELPDNILNKQYEMFFANDDKKLLNKDVIDKHLCKVMESKNGGKPAIKNLKIVQEKKKPKLKDGASAIATPAKNDKAKIQYISNDDLAFDDFSFPFEFTNGVKGTVAIYQGGIYIKHNGNSPDGKQVNVFTYKGEVGPDSIHFTKDELIKNIINDKEKPNE